MTGETLTADDAWRTARRCRWAFWKAAYARFRYGDGFSHSRALGLQLCLAVVPLLIALVGLSDLAPTTERVGQVLRLTLLSLAPGRSDAVLRGALDRPMADEDDGAQLALWLGLIFAMVTLAIAMGQVERGANRIYGVQRDRPAPRKYGRAALMAVGVGVPAMSGFAVLIAAASFGDAVERAYGFEDDLVVAITVPVGVVLLLASITSMLQWSPYRRQPGWSWLALGAGFALVLSLAFTGLLAAYIAFSDSFGTVYGPLTGIIALLLWAQLTSIAILFGIALAAQLEAVRAGTDHGARSQ